MKLRTLTQSSRVWTGVEKAGSWLHDQWTGSRIVQALSSPVHQPRAGFVDSAGEKLRGLLGRVFQKTGLSRAAEHSIFSHCFFWCALAAVLAPLLPTLPVIAMVALCYFSLLLRQGSEAPLRGEASPLRNWVLLFGLIYILATFTSVNVKGSLYGGMLTVFFTFFGLVLYAAVETRLQMEKLVRFMVLAGALVSLYGIAQYVLDLSGSAAWLDSTTFSDISMRSYSTLENPNVLAEYLLLILPLTLSLALGSKHRLDKLLFWLCLGAGLLCMVLTWSRGGWLGLLFAAAIFLVALDRRFILLGILGLIALPFVLPETVIERFTSIGDMTDSSTTYRVYIWMATLVMLRDYWFSGIGPGTEAFNQVYPKYGYNAVAAPHSHNLYLQIACDTGVCGLVVFLVILFVFLRILFAAMRRDRTADRRTWLLELGVVSGVTGFLVQSMTDYSFYNYRVLLLFWVVVFIGARLGRGFAGEGSGE